MTETTDEIDAETRTEVAARLGYSLSMVSRVLDGHRQPSLVMMNKIAQEYEIPLSELVDARLAGPKSMKKLLNKRIPTLDI